jgi:maltose alpha-D-glucosyltransferase/alpha-amylase
VLPEEARHYFGLHDDGIQMMFNFCVNQRLFYALATGETEPLIDALRATRETPHGAQWAQFLRNHDELDLERLSEEQRERVFAKFGPEERMRLYGRGIRRRLASMLGDRRHIELAYSLLFSLPGTPVIRYGDEIGIGDGLSLTERNSVRTPMQWSREPQAGFSTARQTTQAQRVQFSCAVLTTAPGKHNSFSHSLHENALSKGMADSKADHTRKEYFWAENEGVRKFV